MAVMKVFPELIIFINCNISNCLEGTVRKLEKMTITKISPNCIPTVLNIIIIFFLFFPVYDLKLSLKNIYYMDLFHYH